MGHRPHVGAVSRASADRVPPDSGRGIPPTAPDGRAATMAQQSTPGAVDTAREAPTPRVAVETNGINVIAESERKGTPRQLFWPWFGANVSVFGLAYGSFLLGFGISFWQALVAGVVGVVVSFLLCGFVAIAGKRGSAPTLVLSRAAFGVNGNRVPIVLSWVLTVV